MTAGEGAGNRRQTGVGQPVDAARSPGYMLSELPEALPAPDARSTARGDEVATPTAHYPDLAGKVAVVTGGSRGIGAATSRYLADNGVRVAAVARDRTALGAVVEEIRWAGGTAIGIAADCTDPAAVDAMRERVEREFDEVDVVAAFAGGAGAPRPSMELSVDEWRRILDSDLTATFLTIQAFLPSMAGRGRGSIITMSSAAGRLPSRANAAYAAAKAGVAMLTRHLAGEYAPSGVRLNCVAPSAVRNEKMDRAMSADQLARLGGSFPLRRVGVPDDVAAATAFLASDASSWITGITLDIAGGKIIM
jgi:3-oxoacyl-[acyl-carrier protein] reductase